MFKDVAEALAVLKEGGSDNYRWIAAIDYLLNDAPEENRQQMADKLATMPATHRDAIDEMLKIFRRVKILA
ncbi:hypothetical protein BegalDRAFT_3085 [Beggiatoa alba B18LD]|uniref:Uncharacterized protein n=1 Tax=Beggiatoa alba B18LD TaxID=395493 RepID=I3CJW7_9GAMM|nr:hypothetical protein [Beggiatoa alba]EIJ43910.1 hypothetical protein BegalDRAFT_3085 [Beggiatoa alba B18LD]